MSTELSFFSPGNIATDRVPLRSVDHAMLQGAILRVADDLPNNELTMREFHVTGSVEEHANAIRKHLVGGVTPETAELYFAYPPLERSKLAQAHPNEFLLRFSGTHYRSHQEIQLDSANTYWRYPLFDASRDLAWQQPIEHAVDETGIKLIVGALTGFRAYPEKLARNKDTHPLSVMIATAKELAKTANKATVFDTVTSLVEIPGILASIRLSVQEQRKKGQNKPYTKYELEISNTIESTDTTYPRINIQAVYRFGRNGISPAQNAKPRKVKSSHLSWEGYAAVSVRLAENDFGPKPRPHDTLKILEAETTKYAVSPDSFSEELATALHHLEVPDF